MKSITISAILVLALGLVVCPAKVSQAVSMGTVFTYQGRLIDANSTANGLYDFQFRLFDDANTVTGEQVGSDFNTPDVDVIDGYFTVVLDFNAPNSFNGDARWLEVGVRPGELEDSNAYTPLLPRQEVMPTPYAIYAEIAGYAETAGGIPDSINGSGTANYIAKFTAPNTLGDSAIYESAGDVGIGTTIPGEKLHVVGNAKLTDSDGNDAVVLQADGFGSAGQISMFDTDGDETVRLVAAESSTSGAELLLRDVDGTSTIELDADFLGDGGYIALRKADGTQTITLDADFNGDGRIITEELQITGGSDLSEQFDIKGAKNGVKPGMLVSIDPKRPGKLLISKSAYDSKVAGIISGAGGIKPGMMMGQKDSAADGVYPVALTGRVYCWADASTGAIQPGDLLTTSSIPGHAMKVSDHTRALGAIIGKAMTSLEKGKGMVLVLVSLQ
ncbi:MAG: hypothetical protein ACYTEO_01750 [Planctomycetota bacterium]|jgi:hypothetical protein